MKTKTFAAWMVLAMLVVLFGAPARAQQDKSKRPSPPASASCKFADGKTITVDYSSPRMKGRKIFGGLVPYGQVWRAGANEATTFVTTADLIVGFTHVPAGSYTLFAIPNEGNWTLIISKKTGESGAEYPGETEDFARVGMLASKLPEPVENFTIEFQGVGVSTGGGSAVLWSMVMKWEMTSAVVGISEKK